MTYDFHAIYEHGVLRPLTPLALPESAEVTDTLHVTNGGAASPPSSDRLLGLMADEPDLLDEIVEEAMVARETC